MGIRTRLGTSRGSFDEGPTSNDEVVIETAKGGSTGVLSTDSSGKVSASNIASRIRYEFWDHSIGGQPVPTASYSVMKINGANDNVAGGLNTWNTGTFVFRPESVGSVYTIRLTGKLENPGKNGTLHIDFALSGALPPNYVANYNRQKQGREFAISNSQDHVDIASTFVVFTDQALFVSGGQFYMTSNIVGGINMMSASIFVKEG